MPLDTRDVCSTAGVGRNGCREMVNPLFIFLCCKLPITPHSGHVSGVFTLVGDIILLSVLAQSSDHEDRKILVTYKN